MFLSFTYPWNQGYFVSLAILQEFSKLSAWHKCMLLHGGAWVLLSKAFPVLTMGEKKKIRRWTIKILSKNMPLSIAYMMLIFLKTKKQNYIDLTMIQFCFVHYSGFPQLNRNLVIVRLAKSPTPLLRYLKITSMLYLFPALPWAGVAALMLSLLAVALR